jgi:peptide/nickel transport system substrate-binding protein
VSSSVCSLRAADLPRGVPLPLPATRYDPRVARRGRARWAAPLVTALHVLALGGCSRPAPPPDTLRLAVASPPEALDPRFATSAVATRLSALVAAPLLVIGDDLRPRPFLAERIWQPDPLTWTVKLKPGLRFHDGSPVRAEDVAWTFASMKDPAVGSPHAGRLVHLKDVVVDDELTARFVLDAPYAPFLVDVNAYGILSRRACGRAVDACRAAPIGAGPWRVARALDADEVIQLEAWDGGPVPKPAIERIEVRVARDNTSRLLQLLDGRIDLVASDLLPTDIDVLEDAPGVEVMRASGVGFSYLAFNVRSRSPDGEEDADDERARTRAALADARVRRALALALDLDRVIETKLRGRATRASGMLPAGHWARDPAEAPLPFDPAAARRLLDEAGFSERGARGRFRLRLATTTDRLRRSVALIFADAWRGIGVDVVVEVRDWAALYEDIQRGAFDAFSAKWVPVIEPDLMHWVFSSASIPAPGRAGGNRGGYSSPDVDRWLEEECATTDGERRTALYRAAAAQVARELPVVPLWFEDEVAARASRLQGFTLERTVALLPLAAASLAPTEGAPASLAPTPLAPTPLAPTPLAPTPLAPTPLAPTPLAPTPRAPLDAAP